MIPALEYLSQMCEYALIAEVSATPKPGLVDCHDNGAHTDMCHDTFIASTHAIVPYLSSMALTGYQWDRETPSGLFAAIRPIGVKAEQAMFQATGGVNTHKGIIFSLGIIAAACGLYYRREHCFCPEEILSLSGLLCRDVLEQDFRQIDRDNPRTHGEKLFVRYGFRGIRGEAQNGFPSIQTCSLPAIRRLSQTCSDENPVFLNTLLTLMSQVDDTNVLARTGRDLLAYEKSEAARILGLGGALSPEGLDALAALNESFIQYNISPGGCADLLAITIFLWRMEQYGGGENETTV